MKKVKKIISALTAAIMGFGCIGFMPETFPDVSIQASAAESGTCGDNLTWVLDGGTLTISGTGNMSNYYSYKDAPWYDYIDSIKSVIIENGVTSIGEYAFRGCSSLTSVIIPDSVTSIGYYAFSKCTSLTSVTIPDSVTSIGNVAFYLCKSLTSVTIPDSVTSIGYYAFSSTSLTSVTIPDSVTSIEGSAFDGCTSLTSVTIPDSVTSIGNSAFAGCSELTSVTMPDSVTSIGREAFSGTPWLDARRAENPLVIVNNILIDAQTASGDVVIPYGVTSVGGGAFSICSSLTSVTIPDSVTSIGEWAFDYCHSLTSVTIPDSVTSIGDYAFYKCDSLTSVTIPDSVTSIGREAFSRTPWLDARRAENPLVIVNNILIDGMTADGDVVIPYGVTSIGDCAFYWYTNLTSVTIPDSVTSIGREAFYYCESLTSVTIPDSVMSIGYYAFTHTPWFDARRAENPLVIVNNILIDGEIVTGDVVIPYGVTSIGEEAFQFCQSLTSVTIPDSVTSIGGYAFYNCPSLTSVTINNQNCEIYDSMYTISYTATIYGYSGSTAEAYANKYGRAFVSLGSYTPPVTTTITTTTTTNPTTTTTSRPTTTTTKQTTTTPKPTTTTTKQTTTTQKPTTTTTKQTTVTTTTTKPATTTVSTTISVSSHFEWGADNWNFLNSRSYFTHSDYYLSSSYLNKLRNNLSNKEWETVKKWKDEEWGGSCYGMSSLVVLSKAGFLPYSDYTSGADCLYDMQNPSQNSQIESLINYYQLLQVTDITQQRRYGVINSDNKTNINNIINKLKTGSPVLIGYRRDGWGGHAVVAYDVSYGNWTWNGVTYQGQIKIVDPNSSRSYDNRYCIYFNTSTYNWIIPAYNPISSVYGAIFTNITNYIDEINYGGYLNGSVDYVLSENYIASLNMSEISDNYSVSKVRLVNDNFEYAATDADDIIPNKFYVEGGESEGTDGYILKDAQAGYKVSQDNPTIMDLTIDYENCLFNASSAAGREIIFDNNGIVSITSESADCTAEMIYNDGYYDTDWYGIKVSCSGVDNIILEQTDGGYYLSGNILENVTVNAFNDNISANAQFSTDAGKVYIYEIDENTVGISIDTDGDGTFETKLNTTEPADEPTDNGDINGDGKIDISDATMVLMMYAYSAAGMDMSEYTEEQLSAADIDGDGKVSISDATYILTYYAQNAAGMNPSWEDILKK